jgi:hypothetical protein
MPVGEETGEIARGEADGYRVHITEIDGHVADSLVADATAIPSERLAASVLPAMLATETVGVGTHTALSMDGGAARVAPLEIAQLEPEVWQVQVRRPGQVTQQTYRFAADGAFQGLEEMTWRGLREVRPDSGTAADGG